MNLLFETCRELNVILGPIAFGCLCYRAVIGVIEQRIAYSALFCVFVYYVLVAALGAPTGIVVGSPVTYLSPMLTVGHIALIVICVFYPGPLKHEDTLKKGPQS